MRTLLIASTLLLSSNSFAFNDFEKALTSYSNNNIDEAYIHLKNILNEDSDNLPATVLMGRTLLKKGVYFESIDVFQDALFKGTDVNVLIDDLLTALMLTRSFDEIIALNNNKKLNEASKLSTTLFAGDAYTLMRDYTNALLQYKQAHKLAPNNLRTITSLASFYLEQNKIPDASAFIDKGINLFPDDSRVWILQGQLHASLYEDVLSLKAYEKGYQLNPDDPFIQRELANAYAHQNLPDKALLLVNTILKNTPEDIPSKLLKSKILSSSAKEESEQLLVEISQQMSLLSDAQKANTPSLVLISGTVSYLQNNIELAQTELQFYVKAVPHDVNGISLLVDIYTSQNQHKKALELLESKNKYIHNNLPLSLKLFELYLNNNKTYKAQIILESLEEKYKTNLAFILAKANWLAKIGQYANALEWLEKHKPDTFSASYLLTKGLILKVNNQLTEAHNIADKLLELNSNNSDYLTFKAALHLSQQQWQKSIDIYNKILEKKPGHYSSSFNKSSALSALGKYTEAQKIIDTLSEKYSTDLSLQILNAKIYRDTGKIVEARSILQNILDNNTNNVPALKTLMDLNYREKEYEEALKQAEQLSKLSLLNSVYIERKAQIYIGLKDYNNAKKQLRSLSRMFKTPRELYRLSQMQIQTNDLTAAKESLTKALSIAPENKVLQLRLIRLEIDLDNYKAVEPLLFELDKKYPNDPNVLMLKGDYHVKLAQLNQAQKNYIQALTLDNNFNSVLMKLNQLAINNIGKQEFESTLLSILEKTPTNYLVRTVLADYYLINKRNNEAKIHYEELINVDNLLNKSLILNNLANIYITSDLIKAEMYSKQALDLNASSSAFLDTYGWILTLNDKFSEGLTMLRKAYSLNSSDPTINYHIGYTLIKLDRNNEAKRELRIAINSKYNFPEKDDAQALLNSTE